MGEKTKIEWCDATWNPTSGCTPISAGCQNCWAKRMTKRLAGRCGYHTADPFRVTFHSDQLNKPLHWKQPRRIAVSLMGDLFHTDVPYHWIDKVFAVMALCQQHTFMVLTKRPNQMATYLASTRGRCGKAGSVQVAVAGEAGNMMEDGDAAYVYVRNLAWPLSNVTLGTSVENKLSKWRIDALRQCPAAIRCLSLEPLIEDLGTLDMSGVHWVIVGGESGPGARPMRPDWARSIRDQCQAAGVKFFFKQWGEWRNAGSRHTGALGRFAIVNDNNFIETDLYPRSFDQFGAVVMERVGKKTAGRLIDGREWNEIPEVA